MTIKLEAESQVLHDLNNTPKEVSYSQITRLVLHHCIRTFVFSNDSKINKGSRHEAARNNSQFLAIKVKLSVYSPSVGW